jgi:hypothetical protein
LGSSIQTGLSKTGRRDRSQWRPNTL